MVSCAPQVTSWKLFGIASRFNSIREDLGNLIFEIENGESSATRMASEEIYANIIDHLRGLAEIYRTDSPARRVFLGEKFPGFSEEEYRELGINEGVLKRLERVGKREGVELSQMRYLKKIVKACANIYEGEAYSSPRDRNLLNFI